MAKVLTEGTLVAPIFSGTDDELTNCTNAWSSIVNSLNYTNWMYSCTPGNSTQIQMSKENKMALYNAIISFCNSKISEIEQLPQTTGTIAASQQMQPTAPVTVNITNQDKAQSQSQSTSKPDSYAESLKEHNSKFVQRMRELAGVPHYQNRV